MPRAEANLRRHTGLLTASFPPGPFLGQVEADIHQGMPTAPQQQLVILDKGSAPEGPQRTVMASYRKPYLMHASIGPSCAVAQLVAAARRADAAAALH